MSVREKYVISFNLIFYYDLFLPLLFILHLCHADFVRFCKKKRVGPFSVKFFVVVLQCWEK